MKGGESDDRDRAREQHRNRRGDPESEVLPCHRASVRRAPRNDDSPGAEGHRRGRRIPGARLASVRQARVGEPRSQRLGLREERQSRIRSGPEVEQAVRDCQRLRALSEALSRHRFEVEAARDRG